VTKTAMPKSTHSSLSRGYTIALIAAAILSTTAIFIRFLTTTYHIPALVLAFWRDVFVVVTLVVIFAIRQPRMLRVDRHFLPFLVAYGFVLSMFNSLWTLSVALNGAAVSTVLAYTSAGFSALLGWWLLKERLGVPKLLAVAISLGGCVLVSGALDPSAWGANVIGILTGTISGLGYAGYSLMGRVSSQRGQNPWTALLYTFGFAAIFLFLFNVLLGGVVPGTASGLMDFFWLGDAWVGWVVLFLLAAGPTVAGYGLYNVSLTYLPSSVANLVVTIEPVFTTLTAYLLLGERLTAIQLAGGLMILGGVVFLRISEGWQLNRAKDKASAAITEPALNDTIIEK
jgi:drug/metabolite transporter (DMT)-like permease